MSVRPSTVANMLDTVAAYIDLRDPGLRNTEVQDDLRAVAEWLRDHPETDADMHAALPPSPQDASLGILPAAPLDRGSSRG